MEKTGIQSLFKLLFIWFMSNNLQQKCPSLTSRTEVTSISSILLCNYDRFWYSPIHRFMRRFSSILIHLIEGST